MNETIKLILKNLEIDIDDITDIKVQYEKYLCIDFMTEDESRHEIREVASGPVKTNLGTLTPTVYGYRADSQTTYCMLWEDSNEDLQVEALSMHHARGTAVFLRNMLLDNSTYASYARRAPSGCEKMVYKEKDNDFCLTESTLGWSDKLQRWVVRSKYESQSSPDSDRLAFKRD